MGNKASHEKGDILWRFIGYCSILEIFSWGTTDYGTFRIILQKTQTSIQTAFQRHATCVHQRPLFVERTHKLHADPTNRRRRQSVSIDRAAPFRIHPMLDDEIWIGEDDNRSVRVLIMIWGKFFFENSLIFCSEMRALLFIREFGENRQQFNRVSLVSVYFWGRESLRKQVKEPSVLQ